MSVYTVHSPLPRDAVASDPESFVFVRDGFHFWAFVFGPVWLLFKCLWLAFAIYIGTAVVLQVGLWLLHVPRFSQGVVVVLMHLLVGFEAATIRRWTLNLRGWSSIGLVAGKNREAAEQRFFDAWVARARPEARSTLPPSPSPRAPQPPSDIIGLFPEAQPHP